MAHTKNWIRRDKRLAIYLRDGFACAYCGARAEDRGVMLSLDHLICRSAGGGNNASNLITACMKCNSERRDIELGDWLEMACGDDAAKTARFIVKHTAMDLKPYREEAKEIISRRKDAKAAK